MPTRATADGRSPPARPTITGTTADSTAVIGATMLIVPVARPRYSSRMPTPPTRPPTRAERGGPARRRVAADQRSDGEEADEADGVGPQHDGDGGQPAGAEPPKKSPAP